MIYCLLAGGRYDQPVIDVSRHSDTLPRVVLLWCISQTLLSFMSDQRVETGTHNFLPTGKPEMANILGFAGCRKHSRQTCNNILNVYFLRFLFKPLQSNMTCIPWPSFLGTRNYLEKNPFQLCADPPQKVQVPNVDTFFSTSSGMTERQVYISQSARHVLSHSNLCPPREIPPVSLSGGVL